MLSDSYVVEVTYKQGEEDLDSESWFVKVNTFFKLMHNFMDLGTVKTQALKVLQTEPT